MKANDLILELSRRYCEPNRHYHTIEHIARMLFLGRELDLSDEQVLAIWFHDAVYDSRSDTNEEDSAELADSMMSAAEFNDESIELVKQIVLDTKIHQPSCPQAAAVIDLDLASLAVPWEEYERNRRNIRLEYDWVAHADYEAGLRSFLVSFLDRPRIYWTDWGANLEAPARSNLSRALEALEVGEVNEPDEESDASAYE